MEVGSAAVAEAMLQVSEACCDQLPEAKIGDESKLGLTSTLAALPDSASIVIKRAETNASETRRCSLKDGFISGSFLGVFLVFIRTFVWSAALFRGCVGGFWGSQNRRTIFVVSIGINGKNIINVTCQIGP